MLEIAMLIVAVATCITSVVGPILSVYAAQRLVRQDASRQVARDAFLRVSKDIQDFRVAFLAYYTDLANKSPGFRGSAHDLQRMVTILNADCLLLGLIFDKKADPMGSKVQQLAESAKLLFSDSPPPHFDECQKGLATGIQAICDEMKPLWDCLQGSAFLVTPRLRDEPSKPNGRAQKQP